MSAQLLKWPVVEAVLRGARLALLYGPPGTGKTTAAVNVGRAMGRSVYNVTLTDETPAAELRGHWVPTGEKWEWHDGPAMRAFREGAILVLNEIDKASADALDFCHTLLDDPGISQITLPNGETVFPHSDFRVIATTNGSPQDLPPAIADRFAIAVEILEPHPDAVKALPKDLQNAAKAQDPDPTRPATMRRLVAFDTLRNADEIGPDAAALAVFAHRAAEVLDSLRIAGSR